MVRLPRECDFDRSRLIVKGRTLKREFYDEEGNVIYVASMRVVEETGIDIDQRVDPTAYHREYYRRVRRHRDGRVPRGSPRDDLV